VPKTFGAVVPKNLRLGSAHLGAKASANYRITAIPPRYGAPFISQDIALYRHIIYLRRFDNPQRLHKEFRERRNSPFPRMYIYTGSRYEVWEMQFSFQGRNEGESMYSQYEEFQNKGVRSQGRINPLSVISDVKRIHYTRGLKFHVIASATTIPRASQRTSVV